jgi:NADH:ubiquinone oxidoreductase subunit 3 (subunit A)
MVFLNHSLIFFIYFLVIVIVTIILLALVYILNKPLPYFNKNFAYECGFAPFLKTIYQPFDVQFYRVGILFLLFDIEVIILLPWSINFFLISELGHFAVFSFLIIVLFAFIYEFYEGLLNWYPNVIKYTYLLQNVASDKKC